jgi:hypothetical protein
MPQVYHCPAELTAGGITTSYVAVVGPNAAWRGGRALRLYTDFNENLGNLLRTVALVEVADSGIEWMEPRDLTFSEAVGGVNRDGVLGVRSHHVGSANSCRLDGTVQELRNSISIAILKKVFAVNTDKANLDDP